MQKYCHSELPHQITTHFKGNEKDKNKEPPDAHHYPSLTFCARKERKKMEEK